MTSHAKPARKSTKSGPKKTLDKIDLRILNLIQANGRLANKELAPLVNLSPTPCLRRTGRLTEAGYVTRFKAVLDPARLGFGIRAYLSIKRRRDADRDALARRIASIPEVVACHVVSGDYDLMAEIIARDMAHYANITLETISSIGGVHDLRSTFSILAVKTDGDIPLEGASVVTKR